MTLGCACVVLGFLLDSWTGDPQHFLCTLRQLHSAVSIEQARSTVQALLSARTPCFFRLEGKLAPVSFVASSFGKRAEGACPHRGTVREVY